MSEHTPGPWAMFGPYENGFLDSGYLITTGYDVYPPEPDVGIPDGRQPLHGPRTGFQEADARLIAAAPDLLALVQRIAAHYEKRIEAQLETHDPECSICAATENARAAIAKATGKSP